MTDAIILAAGMGIRLRSFLHDRPKGLIEIEGETLVGRSVRLLRSAGVSRITIVAGFEAEEYERFAGQHDGIDIIMNEDFATTGSMASLAIGLRRVDRDVLVLESDLVYDSRALQTILDRPAIDATIASGPTGAGDEVFVDAPDGRLRAMSKNVHELAGVDGEFVGITRLSRPAGREMLRAFEEFLDRHRHARMNYETDALVEVTSRRPIAVHLIRDLCWGEIDDEQQYQRVRNRVWPVVTRERPKIAT
jgi:choline kinase